VRGAEGLSSIVSADGLAGLARTREDDPVFDGLAAIMLSHFAAQRSFVWGIEN
jgi:hypothetical protein